MTTSPTLDVSSHLANLDRRLADLRTFQLPRLREYRGPLDLHRELADELRGDLENLRRGIEVESHPLPARVSITLAYRFFLRTARRWANLNRALWTGLRRFSFATSWTVLV